MYLICSTSTQSSRKCEIIYLTGIVANGNYAAHYHWVVNGRLVKQKLCDCNSETTK